MGEIAILPRGLRLVEDAARMLSQATTIDEIKDIRDKAEAIRAYYRQVGAGLEAQNAAAKIKIMSERKIGELLASSGLRPGRPKNGNTMLPLSLDDLGIEKMQSSRWQQMASVPAAAFEGHVAKSESEGRELTSSSVLKLAKKSTPEVPVSQASPEVAAGCFSDLQELIDDGKKYGCIYADPPWKYSNKATRANVEAIYDGTMDIAALKAMRVEDLAADDAHLHLWTTNAFMPYAFGLMEKWGFEYRSCFVWVKPQMGIGNYWRVSHEFMLLGIRGDAKRFNNHSQMSWRSIDRTKHSAKPDEIRDTLRLVSPGPYLELFGRKAVSGWDVFGNQIETAEVAA